ncbi:hypothetical protein EVAR_23651_1 [Eumeta japonica]|uniref:Uncharacterized protein n=1 Tax=Eumeta variegata TaxID=151549 RepID=A0A4C1VHM3_EUMVA|nr:hypothetical protein EVAR_23651_1 [Eumeta japonica]
MLNIRRRNRELALTDNPVTRPTTDWDRSLFNKVQRRGPARASRDAASGTRLRTKGVVGISSASALRKSRLPVGSDWRRGAAAGSAVYFVRHVAILTRDGAGKWGEVAHFITRTSNNPHARPPSCGCDVTGIRSRSL